MYQRILLAVDLTSDSLVVGRRARLLADALGAQLRVITVIEPVAPITPIPPVPVGGDVVVNQVELLRAAEERIGPLVRELGVPDGQWKVVLGSIKSEIVRAAVDENADLIVIGGHERHGLAFLTRPTEDAVLHQAPCDVLAVRLP
jgi:universal stress protein A